MESNKDSPDSETLFFMSILFISIYRLRVVKTEAWLKHIFSLEEKKMHLSLP